MKKTFEQWMSEVNKHLIATVGMSSDEIDDANYAAWYDDGVSPKTAAKRAIKLAS